MKIIIAGAGEVGCHLAKMLVEDNHDLVVIDHKEERLNNALETSDIVTILGNPTSMDVLRSAGVEKADLFIAVCPDKEQYINIISSLLAKQIGAKKVTARVNNQEYLSNENKLIFTQLGIDLLFYPEKIAANEICDLMKKSEASEYVDFANGKLQLIVFKLETSSPLIDKAMKDLDMAEIENKFKIVALTRGDTTLIPNNETIFRYKDLLYVVAVRESIAEATSYSGKEGIELKHVTILGGGSIGEMVAHQLEHRIDSVRIIEADKDRCDYLANTLDKTLVLNTDMSSSNPIHQDMIGSCDTFIAVTQSSESNILACVAAKRLGVAKTIAEVENIKYITMAEEMGVDAVINKKLITAGRIFRFTLSNKVRTVKCLSGSNSEVLEYVVNADSLITTAPLSEIKFPKDAIIGGIVRNGESLIALENTVIRAYDRVAVFALPSAINKIDKFFV